MTEEVKAAKPDQDTPVPVAPVATSSEDVTSTASQGNASPKTNGTKESQSVGEEATTDDTQPAPLVTAERSPVKVDPVELAQTLVLKSQFYFPIIGTAVWFFGYYGFSFFWVLLMFTALMAAEGLRFVFLLKKKIKEHADEFRQPNKPEHESTVFINQIFEKVWRNYNGFIEAEVRKNIEAQIAAKKPAALDELKLDEFSIGKNIPHLSNFRLWRDHPQEIKLDVQLDWDSDIVVSITAAKSSIKVPVTASHVSVHANLRIFARLLPNKEPFITYAWVQALDRPDIDVRLSLPVIGLIVVVRKAVSEVGYAVMGYPKRVEVDIGRMMKAEITERDLLPPPLPAELAGSLLGAFTGMMGGLVGGVAGAGGAILSGTGNLAMGAGGLVGDAASGLGKAGMGIVGDTGKMGASVLKAGGGMLGLTKKKDKDKDSNSASQSSKDKAQAQAQADTMSPAQSTE
eukprot:Ihof_evm12s164 gene=Ihof_evmTU12s164